MFYKVSSGGTDYTKATGLKAGVAGQQTNTYNVSIGDTLVIVSTNTHDNLTQSITGATQLFRYDGGVTRAIFTIVKATSTTVKVTQSDYQGYSNQIVVNLH